MNICIYKGDLLKCLQANVQVVQSWLSPERQIKDLVVFQSVRMHVSAHLCWNKEEVGSNADEGMSQQQDG